jgi:hypothetical protein
MVSVMVGRSVVRQHRAGVALLSMYSKHWPCLFPQHGPGTKHQRPIVLEEWQRTIALEAHPDRFVRGLVHSDGWRGINNVRGADGQPYAYSRYQFSNRSLDIQELFVDACTALGVECRQMNRWNISVNTRQSVALLDKIRRTKVLKARAPGGIRTHTVWSLRPSPAASWATGAQPHRLPKRTAHTLASRGSQIFLARSLMRFRANTVRNMTVAGTNTRCGIFRRSSLPA